MKEKRIHNQETNLSKIQTEIKVCVGFQFQVKEPLKTYVIKLTFLFLLKMSKLMLVQQHYPGPFCTPDGGREGGEKRNKRAPLIHTPVFCSSLAVLSIV